ncbi:MAG: Fic family protein [Clostridia bacterium]|nr:Fic family protein [Clostridia bacterium]
MYDSLLKIFHSDIENYNKIYESRFGSDSAVHLDFTIHQNKAFFIETPELLKIIISIQKLDKDIQSFVAYLPNLSITQFTKRCLIDEIVLSNNIEGVHSTRKEIDSVLTDLQKSDSKKRFKGLVNKYIMLMYNETIDIESAKDIRDIYDELALPEVIEDDPSNFPDGKIFRKNSVSVLSPTGKEIHTGLLPEEKIIEAMNSAINILNDDQIVDLFRVSIFHYLFGYIHPFYDGNGRTSRFISSYLLSKQLEPLIGYRISYTIQENIKEYYEAFKTCNDPRNKGDLTPFLYMFTNIVYKSMYQLAQALSNRVSAMNHYLKAIPYLPEGTNQKLSNVYDYLVQATLFAEHGISTKELIENTGESRNTIKKRLATIESNGLLAEKKNGNEKFFTLNLNVVDEIIAKT